MCHIDTSCDYGSEPTIGAAIRASGWPRNRFFITSKLDPENYSSNMQAVMQQQVLQPLNVSYVDLLLLHHAGRYNISGTVFPPCLQPTNVQNGTYYQCRMEAWSALKDIQSLGWAKAIGVSNWIERDLQQLFDYYGEYPAINQCEHHPYYFDKDLVAFHTSFGIIYEAYAPFAAYPRSPMLNDSSLPPIAQKHSVSIGQVVLRWAMQAGASIVIPRSMNPTHMAENINIFNFQLDDTDMNTLSNLPQQKVYKTQCQPWC